MVELSPKAPTAAEALALRAVTGWGPVSDAGMRAALAGSALHVSAREENTLVGMARAVGDGVLNLYIQDVIVRPRWRGRGLARDMVADLLARIRAQADPGMTVGLMAVAGLEPFYASLGFTARPEGRFGAGMTLFT